MNLRYIIAATALLVCGVIEAQNLQESLTVEGTYTPEVIAADRLSATPAGITLTAPESTLSYDRRGVTANFAPDALAMPATGWRTSRAFDTSRGYVDLTLGSWLNASLSAGYAAIRNEDTKLNVWLQHNSTSLWKAWKADPANGIDQDASRRYRYDETIGADFSHRFGNVGTLSTDFQYHYGHFNYYASKYKLISERSGKETAPAQDLNDVYAHVGWNSRPTEKISYAVDADVRYFGFRNDYYPYASQYIGIEDGGRETALNVGGRMDYTLSKTHKLAIGLQYSGVYNLSDYVISGSDATSFKLLPAYEYSNGNTSLRIGAELALADEHYWEYYEYGQRLKTKYRFRIAPDIRFSARKDALAFSTTIGGGTYMRTLAWLYSMDYYTDPGYTCEEPTYSPIDARIALQYNPGGKFTIGIEGIWTTLLNQPFGGIYQSLLNHNSPEHYVYIQDHIHGFSIGVNAGYDFCKYFALHGRFNWQPQHGTSGILNGFDRPAITANVTASSHPIEPLTISLGYDLRAKRYLLKSNLALLNMAADYQINKKLAVGLRLDNLLNRRNYLLPDLPTEGFTAAGRVQIIF